MKAFAAAVVVIALCAGAARRVFTGTHRSALNLAPPIFRGSDFKAHERVDVSVRGAAVPSVHAMTDARGHFRVRLAAMPSCKAWTVRARGVQGGVAVHPHSRCGALQTDVKGVVRRGPTRNICIVGEPWTAPAAGVTVQALESGRLVAETTTGDNGRFSFSVADGSYTIPALGRGTEPKTVHATASNPVRLAFLIDTGIR